MDNEQLKELCVSISQMKRCWFDETLPEIISDLIETIQEQNARIEKLESLLEKFQGNRNERRKGITLEDIEASYDEMGNLN